jgi:hypothetical protein
VPLILAGVGSLALRSRSTKPAGAGRTVVNLLGGLACLAIVAFGAAAHFKLDLFMPAGLAAPAAAQGAVASVGQQIGSGRAGGTPGRVDSATIRTANPDFSLTAQQLFDEYQQDKAETHKKYEGKVIEVTGVVMNCRASGDQATLNFNIKKEEDKHEGAGCILQEKKAWGQHGNGQKVKVKGTWGGRGYFGAAIVDAVVVEADPNPAVLYPSEQMARDYEANPADMSDRYDGKSVVVEGEVVKKEEQKGAFNMLFFKGTDKTQVACRFEFSDREQTDPVKVGQKVKVYGEYSLLFSSDNNPTLHWCLLVPGATNAQPPRASELLDPYRNVVKDPQKIAAMLNKAAPDKKLVPVEFTLAGVECTMQAPEGAKVKAEGGSVEIREGGDFSPKFQVVIQPGRSNLAALQKAWLNPKPPAEREDEVRTREFIIAGDDLVFRRVLAKRYGSWRPEHHFLLTGKVAHLDVHAYSPKDFPVDQCLLMMRCARTLTAKAGAKAPENIADLKKLGLEMTEEGESVSARTNGNFTDGTVELLVKLAPNITDLRLWSPITDQGLRHVAGLKKLRSLSVAFMEDGAVDGSGLAGVAGLTNLEVLDLNGTSVTDASLAHLRGLKKLRNLRLDGTPVTGMGFFALKNRLPELEDLSLSGSAFQGSNLSRLSSFAKLKNLNLRATAVADESLAALGQLPALEVLFLNEIPVGDAGMKNLAGTKNLRLLSIEKTKVTDAGLAHLKELPKLSSIYAKDSKITAEGKTEFKKARPMVSLHIE